jgi:hypothetical protein
MTCKLNPNNLIHRLTHKNRRYKNRRYKNRRHEEQEA